MRDGFTLLEALVSLTILSLVGIAALGAVGRDLDAAARARVALETVALAEDRLEVARLLDAPELAVLPDSVARGRFPPPFDRYSWQTAVQVVPGPVGLYDVIVEVSWKDGRRSLHTRIYRPPAVVVR